MRVVDRPGQFAGTLTAAEAAAAIAAGLAQRRRPATTSSSRPLSDGGPGFLDAVPSALGGD